MLWQQALVAGEAAFEQHKQEAVDKIELAEKQKIGALERQQKAENMVQAEKIEPAALLQTATATVPKPYPILVQKIRNLL